MKKSILFFSLSILLTSFALAENLPHPEKIYSFARVTKSFDYYVEQANLWKKETEKTRSNGDAWFNYFQASRYANIFSKGENVFDLDALVKELSDAIPNTAEYYIINFIHKGRGSDHFDLLLKAYELNTNQMEIIGAMVAYHEIKGEREQLRLMCEKYFQHEEMSSGLLKWNYNMLMSVEDNAILLTWGDNDTYPSWILQQVKNVRPDVVIINTSLLTGHEVYRNMIFEKYDIPAMEKPWVEDSEFFKMLSFHMLQNTKRPAYISPAIPSSLRGVQSENLYLTGMAFKWSPEEFDNVAMMKNNFENKFLKDYLMIDLENDISKDVVNNLNLNYLPAFLKLYRHYEESGEVTKGNQMKTLLKKVAEKGGKLDDIKPYIGESIGVDKTIESILDIKTLDRGFVKVKDNLYAAETELMIKQYEQFLMDLLKNREFDKLEIAKTGKTNWRSFLPEKFQSLSDTKLYDNGHPDAPECPIQNISYEAAKLYCEWVTEIYNASDHKKKMYKRVVFRLPTEGEWFSTAHGGHESALYPWGGFYVRNIKGCFLSNFDVLDYEPCTDCKVQLLSNDGGFFPVKADAYFPNDYGCYNMSGNVAEMIQEKGIAMGGSWADDPDKCKVFSKQEFEEPNPKVGFRVFMEVLEYK